MKILIDMNLTPQWVTVLAKYDIQAVHWSMVGDPRAPDRDIMEWAKINDYIIFTNDLDFGTILAATAANSPSVIQFRTQDLLPASLEKLVIDVLRKFANQLKLGALITIDVNRSKVRILPIEAKN
jgi:predicted nuclease of predicted toxin-antitoxin system